ncbi:EF-hand [Meira miltonrushii]|uniref:EF-hand n=1 Tax=Meira miltonrushii TaxID=1280837 RepID=A0A316V4X6_9BASI|nr:EF-hand [Meira miltonrushii]PWN32596.1 EF-hand [Meira miltonrushii]
MSYQYSYGPQGGGGGRPPPQQQGGYQQGGYQQGGYQQGGGYGGAPYQSSQYGGGGGGRPQAFNQGSGPPPGGDPQLWSWFMSVDRDGSGQINATELQQALVNGDWTPFSTDCVKLLMNMFDHDRSGTITFNEFAGLWKYIQDWQGVFRHFDADRSGSIDQGELSRALSNFGYNLNPRLLHLMTQKFVTSSDVAGSTRGTITFDGFVRCCVVVKTLTESFARRDVQRTGRITISYDDFMDICLSAP